ncbi:MAG TPA: hypothetical protein VE959_30595 [Bryobacteraceae bacterium]|nr:hypothetical protein [Bryobacteraceae bacterium]
MGLKQAELVPSSETPAIPALSLDVQRWTRVGEDNPAQNLSAEDKAAAEKRFEIIEPLVFPERFPELWHDCTGRKLAVVARLAEQHGRPARTIRHWLTRYRRDGMRGLVDRDRADKGFHRKLNKPAKELLLQLAIPRRGVFGALSSAEIHRFYEDIRVWVDDHIGKTLAKSDREKYACHLDQDGRMSESARLPKLSPQTVRRCVCEIPEAVRTLARNGEDAYRATQEIISYRDLADIEPLSWLCMDHRVLDCMAIVPTRGGWRLVRPWLTGAVDIRTRKFLGWGLFETPSSEGIATVLKKVLIDHGVPTNLLIDNGKDFRCSYLEGGKLRSEKRGPVGDFDATWRGVFGTLGIRVVHSLPYNARAKIIEPLWGRISNFDRQLPEWCGHRPSERPERFDLLIKQHEAFLRGERVSSPFRTIQQLAALYNEAIPDINERELQGHGMNAIRANGRGWLSPAECWDLLIPRVERRTVRVEDLHIVFTRRRTLTVKHGEILMTFGGDKFHYRLEGEPVQLMALNGQLVEIGFDVHDLGEAAVYWRNRFVGLAHCAPLRKMGLDTFTDDERARRAARREIRRAIDAVHQQSVVPTIEERLARRREALPCRDAAARAEIPLALPAAVEEAAAAAREDREFRFEQADSGMVGTTLPTPTEGDDDFCFFQGEPK